MLNDEEPQELVPWFRGFKGNIEYKTTDTNGNHVITIKVNGKK